MKLFTNLNVRFFNPIFISKLLIFLLVFGVPLEDLLVGEKKIIPNNVEAWVSTILLKGKSADLFSNTDSDLLVSLRESIDQKIDYDVKLLTPGISFHLLLSWLKELPEPLFPFSKFEEIVAFTS